MDLADMRPERGPATSEHAVNLEELATNAAYASLVCISAAVVFVVASIGTHWVLRVSSGLGLALGAHLVLVLLMVMKRVFALTQERLRRARTGADMVDQRTGRRGS
jgi:amino acid permease